MRATVDRHNADGYRRGAKPMEVDGLPFKLIPGKTYVNRVPAHVQALRAIALQHRLEEEAAAEAHTPP